MKLVERMPRVCKVVIKAKGGDFEESKNIVGGQVRRPPRRGTISGSHQTLWNCRPSHPDNSVTRWVANRP